MSKDSFRPIKSRFRDLWCGETSDAIVIRLDPKALPLQAKKPVSKKKGEVVGLSESHRWDDKWGNEKIDINNY